MGIAVDASNVYWTNMGTPSASFQDGSVMKIPLGGGTPVTLASGQDNPTNVAVDGDSVYWIGGTDGTVMKIPLDGGTPVTLASGQPHPVGLTVDSTSVYWTNIGTANGDGAVMKLTPKQPPRGGARSRASSVVAFSVDATGARRTPPAARRSAACSTHDSRPPRGCRARRATSVRVVRPAWRP